MGLTLHSHRAVKSHLHAQKITEELINQEGDVIRNLRPKPRNPTLTSNSSSSSPLWSSDDFEEGSYTETSYTETDFNATHSKSYTSSDYLHHGCP